MCRRTLLHFSENSPRMPVKIPQSTIRGLTGLSTIIAHILKTDYCSSVPYRLFKPCVCGHTLQSLFLPWLHFWALLFPMLFCLCLTLPWITFVWIWTIFLDYFYPDPLPVMTTFTVLPLILLFVLLLHMQIWFTLVIVCTLSQILPRACTFFRHHFTLIPVTLIAFPIA